MMSLYEVWSKQAYEPKTQEEYNSFWNEYIPKEEKVYKRLLSEHDKVFEGKLAELAESFSMDALTFVGFMDGINTSLVSEYDIENLTEETDIRLAIDFEKLYFNMHDAKADWLYNLEEWGPILSEERRLEIAKEYRKSKTIVKGERIGRNDPCSCGSGKKYKKCCGKDME